jgi:hypothetical protein
MPESPTTETTSTAYLSPAEPWIPFLGVNLATAIIAAAAAQASALLSVPVWAMFVGWVVFYTRGQSRRDGIVNIVCLIIGIAIGLTANFSMGPLLAPLGAASLPSFVLVTSFLVMSLRALPVINNIPAYFLGLTSVFAAQAQPGLEAFMELSVASAIGGLAGWAARTLHRKLAR